MISRRPVNSIVRCLPKHMNEVSPNERERYVLNAKGDFYVENGICLCCMIPEIEASELMDFNNAEMHCYFKRQPLTDQELEHAIAAVAASDIQGLRYAGNDKYILDRLVALGAGECCDALTAKGNSKPKEGESGFSAIVSKRSLSNAEFLRRRIELALAADGATAFFSSSSFPLGLNPFARRS